MKRSLLFILALVSYTGDISRDQARATPKPDAMNMKQAVHIALDALGEQPARWTKGCNIQARPGADDWTIFFEPIPMGPGFDVMVIVRSDGSTIVGPGY